LIVPMAFSGRDGSDAVFAPAHRASCASDIAARQKVPCAKCKILLALPSIKAHDVPITDRPVAFIGDETAVALPPHANRSSAMLGRHRSESLQDRLTAFAQETREKASALPPGLEQQEMLRKARQADTAVHLDDWLNSPGLQSPK
jgi:hypothetical protein